MCLYVVFKDWVHQQTGDLQILTDGKSSYQPSHDHYLQPPKKRNCLQDVIITSIYPRADVFSNEKHLTLWIH